MPINIKLLKNGGGIEQGEYAARLLHVAFSLRPDAQIIEGEHAGQIIPYEWYITLDKKPVQLDSIKQQEKMIAQLAGAGLQIKEQARKIGALQEENEKLRNGEYAINLYPQIAAYKERIQQLEGELKARGEKVELPLDVAEAINTCKAAGLDGFSIIGLLNVIGQLFRDYGPNVLRALEIIKQFSILPEGRENLLRALVNGYTLAPEPEKDEAAILVEEVDALLDKWVKTWLINKSLHLKSPSSLTEWICDYIKQREDSKPPF